MEEDAADLIYGRRVVLEALRAGRQVNRLFVLAGAGGVPPELFRLARERSIPVVRGDRQRLERLARGGNHQGVVAQVASRSFAAVQEVFEAAAASPRLALVLALDGVQDPQNLGALIRTAEAAGCHGLVLEARGSCGLTATVSRAAAGADEHLPVSRVVGLHRTLADCAASGFSVVASDPAGTLPYWEAPMTEPTVLVLGAEGRGLTRAVLEACTHRVRIPMLGRVESLNVAAAGAVLLFEAARQRSGLAR
ncbi:MAG: 23S rRNA (guanosine(2251)-2'-O)-methyltransferase RlmB [Candidatus Eremiobacterota bacterium]